MRGSLQGVRFRVERLARHVQNGCTACRGDEAKLRIRWRDSPNSDTLADRPQTETCAVCGRIHPLHYKVIGWIPNDAVDGTPPQQSLDR